MAELAKEKLLQNGQLLLLRLILVEECLQNMIAHGEISQLHPSILSLAESNTENSPLLPSILSSAESYFLEHLMQSSAPPPPPPPPPLGSSPALESVNYWAGRVISAVKHNWDYSAHSLLLACSTVLSVAGWCLGEPI